MSWDRLAYAVGTSNVCRWNALCMVWERVINLWERVTVFAKKKRLPVTVECMYDKSEGSNCTTTGFLAGDSGSYRLVIEI